MVESGLRLLPLLIILTKAAGFVPQHRLPVSIQQYHFSTKSIRPCTLNKNEQVRYDLNQKSHAFSRLSSLSSYTSSTIEDFSPGTNQTTSSLSNVSSGKTIDKLTVNGDAEASITTKQDIPFPIVLWRFSRPHTLVGSALAIPALHLLAAPTFSAAFTLPMLNSLVYAIIPSLLMNIYITGLNQITDVEIDKINKPYLPIAAGYLSPLKATAIVTICLITSLVMGLSHPILGSQGLNVALWGSAILGTMYSLPPFRLKRFPLLAAFCIVAVRGTIINAGFFAHAQAAALGNPTATALNCILQDKKCFLSSLFFGIFGIVIALMKDVPDVKGDAIMKIRSFSVRVGQKNVFQMMRRLVSALFYVFGIGFLRGSLLAETGVLKACRGLVGSVGMFLGWKASQKAKGVDAEDSGEVYGYYMYLWKLFYLSYLALPFAR